MREGRWSQSLSSAQPRSPCGGTRGVFGCMSCGVGASKTWGWIWKGSGWILRRRRGWCRCRTLNLKGCKSCVLEELVFRHHFAWQLQGFVCLGWPFLSFWSTHIKIAKTFCNSDVQIADDFQFLSEGSQKSFVFELASSIFEGSIASCIILKEVSQKTLFSSLKVVILKEVLKKSFVFKLASCICEGSLAEKL